MKNNYKMYDVVLVDFGEINMHGEQAGKRPAIIVQNEIGNIWSPTTIVMPFTSRIKNPYQPTHSLFRKDIAKGLTEDSMVLGECIRQISEDRIIRKLGSFSDMKDKAEIKRVYFANMEG